MKYTFGSLMKTEGNRSYIEIPFNVWEEYGLKGNIPAKIAVNGIEFECKLLPKGSGKYWIPVKKVIAEKIVGELDVSFELVAALSRINHDSPYSKENPIRNIDSIEEIAIKHGYCGHCCVAMLAGVSLSEIQSVMGKAAVSWSKIQETLDYYGITYSEKMVYPKGKTNDLPKCCVVYADGEFKLWYDGKYYGSAVAENMRIISYLEIMVQ